MSSLVRQRVRVETNGLIQIRVPELKDGTLADVIVIGLPADGAESGLVKFIGLGKGCYASVEEVDSFIRKERDSWE